MTKRQLRLARLAACITAGLCVAFPMLAQGLILIALGAILLITGDFPCSSQ